MIVNNDIKEIIKLTPVNTDLEVCEHAVDAMEMGIKQGEKFIERNKDLDASRMKEVEAVVADYDNILVEIQSKMRICK